MQNPAPPPGEDFEMLGYVDLDGIIRGKYATTAKVDSWRKKGGSFCSVVLGWDSRDALYANRHTGWHTGYHDDPIRIVPGAGHVMPGDGRRFLQDGGLEFGTRPVAGTAVTGSGAAASGRIG